MRRVRPEEGKQGAACKSDVARASGKKERCADQNTGQKSAQRPTKLVPRHVALVLRRSSWIAHIRMHKPAVYRNHGIQSCLQVPTGRIGTNLVRG